MLTAYIKLITYSIILVFYFNIVMSLSTMPRVTVYRYIPVYTVLMTTVNYAGERVK